VPESINTKQEIPRPSILAPSGNSGRPISPLLTFLLPSIADVIFMILFFALTYGSLAPAMLGDADIGWHIRSGENILATRAVPQVDVFSATMAGRTWFAWEWLYDALIAWIHRAAGLNGVVAFSAFCVALTFSFVFRWSLKNGERWQRPCCSCCFPLWRRRSIF